MTHFLEDILRQPEELKRAFDYLCGAGQDTLQTAAAAVRSSLALPIRPTERESKTIESPDLACFQVIAKDLGKSCSQEDYIEQKHSLSSQIYGDECRRSGRISGR
jgi:hypothetical protein